MRFHHSFLWLCFVFLLLRNAMNEFSLVVKDVVLYLKDLFMDFRSVLDFCFSFDTVYCVRKCRRKSIFWHVVRVVRSLPQLLFFHLSSFFRIGYDRYFKGTSCVLGRYLVLSNWMLLQLWHSQVHKLFIPFTKHLHERETFRICVCVCSKLGPY